VFPFLTAGLNYCTDAEAGKLALRCVSGCGFRETALKPPWRRDPALIRPFRRLRRTVACPALQAQCKARLNGLPGSISGDQRQLTHCSGLLHV
jgi:hypothetical protein